MFSEYLKSATTSAKLVFIFPFFSNCTNQSVKHQNAMHAHVDMKVSFWLVLVYRIKLIQRAIFLDLYREKNFVPDFYNSFMILQTCLNDIPFGSHFEIHLKCTYLLILEFMSWLFWVFAFNWLSHWQIFMIRVLAGQIRKQGISLYFLLKIW